MQGEENETKDKSQEGKNMRKINIIITTLILLVIMPMVLGASSMTVPIGYTNSSSPITLTVVYDGWNDVNMTNMTCYYNASGGPATTTLATVENTTSTQTTFTTTGTLSTDALAIYNISCRLNMATGTNASFSAANITIDSTDPLCTLDRKYGRPAYKGIQELTWTSSDALSLISTAVTIDRPQTGSDMSYTDTSKTLTLLSTDTNYVGDWITTLIATDRAGNTVTCTEDWKSYMPNGEGTPGYEETDSNKRLLVIVIILAGGLYLIFKKK